MPDESSIVKQSYQLIRKDFGLEEEWMFKSSENEFSRLESLLAAEISKMIDKNFNQLLTILYRIDIAESVVNVILSTSNNVALDLSKVIVKREKQKVLSRLAHRSS